MIKYDPDTNVIQNDNAYLKGSEHEVIELAYEILREHQSVDQVMTRLQSDIDDQIEREHGIRTEGSYG